MSEPGRRRGVAFCLVVQILAGLSGACARSGGDAASTAKSLALGHDGRAPWPVLLGNEVLTADIYLVGLRLATARVEVQKTSCGPAKGRGRAIINWKVRTTDVVAIFRDIHVEMSVTIDLLTGLPIDDRSHWATDAKPRDYSVHFGRGSYSYDYRRSDGFAKAESVPVPEGLWPYDPGSGVLLLRSFRPAPAERAHFYGVVGRHLWRVDAVFRGSDMVPYRGGTRPAVRIDGVIQKLTGEPDDRGSRDFQIWFSDDGERVPLRVAVDSKLGEVRLELASYEQRSPEGPCAPDRQQLPCPGDANSIRSPLCSPPPGASER
jgi:hypothetical protein